MNRMISFHDQLDIHFFRSAMNHARLRGDRAAARRFADRLNDVYYKIQAARDRAVKVK